MKWLAYGKPAKELLNRREFGFTFDQAMHRYLSFTDPNELTKQLVAKKPRKFEIGAVATVPMAQRDSVCKEEFEWVERELTFDIDMDDYNSVRTCCQDKKVCQKCWSFISIGAKVINFILTEHFGFKKLLFVFSGRRGLHVWCADDKARKLGDLERKAIYDYLNCRDLRINKDKRLHKSILDFCRVILDAPETVDLVVDQGWMENTEDWLKKCPNRKLESQIRTAFKKMPDPAKRFELLKCICDPKSHKESESRLEPPTPEAVAFFYLFLLERMHPKMDAPITTKTYHLLKSPFCVHPETGMVSVPFSANSGHLFRLDKVPRVDELIKQLKNAKAIQDESADEKENARKVLYYKRTDLAPYIENFEVFINNVVKDA
ncbi:unnamed protein product [Bursaphelenchus xylophilus]|nr:unnamed protein product [Bursaphelenchus xylophilus]CAG9128337.1 unnamed protein product [Bursaphelenchus xylophilus]